MRIGKIQEALQETQLDGWLFFDHHHRDPLAYRILGLDAALHASRRWYYFIPRAGEPRGLVHRIEAHVLDGLPGTMHEYSRWDEQTSGIEILLSDSSRIAMQYSAKCAIPYVSMVDAGTVELISALGVEVASSADLVQMFEACWSESQLQQHLDAGKHVDAIRAEAFQLVAERLRTGVSVDEWEIRCFIRSRFAEAGLSTDHGPIVAVNDNASNPHYEPSQEVHSLIRRDDLLLLDMWAKLDSPEAVYYDITWTGFCGTAAPTEMVKVFDVVREARDRAVRRVQDAVESQADLRGFEVDEAAREFITAQGMGEYFVHRTGHSIGTEVHGAGANMDNFETHDDRRVIPWTCFSIEPGVYLPEFGIRSEVNVFVDAQRARVTGEIQTQLATLL
ncbi:MAG TPA: M24 family metallopeptidase [Bryobacteraceae bacterium]|nr:M24 family metallopeptidase [Bryobacteraceae bacterium]